jgi:hypothetical protein
MFERFDELAARLLSDLPAAAGEGLRRGGRAGLPHSLRVRVLDQARGAQRKYQTKPAAFSRDEAKNVQTSNFKNYVLCF